MKNTLIALLAFAFTIAIGDHVPWETYWYASGTQFPFAWDSIDGATKYKWENYSPVKKVVMARGETQQTQAIVTVLTGHNVLSVCACADIEGEEQCSELSFSTDETVATVDTQAKGWWVFGVIGAPGPIEPNT
jgi:hypothetical protein